MNVYKIVYNLGRYEPMREALVFADSKSAAQKVFLSTWQGDMRDKIKIDSCAQSAHTVFLLD